MTKTRPVVSTKQMIPAIRHQGYHTIYALSELIDNSIQAGAKNIEMLCMDTINIDTGTRQLKSIAIHDDGKGMSHDELWNSIRLGESQSRGKGGIGRFGVGLTHASFSQCLRVDVYSWKKPNKILHVYLDLDSLGDTDAVLVEEPMLDKIPDHWKNISNYMSKSGTLVVWSKLDKVRWKKAKTLINNSEFTLGRIYRKFIDKQKLKIHTVSFDGNTLDTEMEEILLPNDPLYLISPSSTPEPWNNKPMFQPDGRKWEERISIEAQDGKKYDVITRYSFVKREVRDGKRNPGNEPYGKHASNNLGVSVIRANRELAMDMNMLLSYDPTERWWGAEIEFPPELDAIFGVSSNKQTASELAHVMQLVGKQNREQQKKHDMDGEEDNPLFTLVSGMSRRITALRNSIDAQRLTVPHNGDPVPNPIPGVPRPNDPTITQQQIDKMTPDERRKALQKLMNSFGIDDPIDWSIDNELRFEHASMTGSQFFDVSLVGGVMVVTINTNHKAYTSLLTLLFNPEERDKIKLPLLLKKSTEGFQKFLASWASLENKTLNPSERKALADVRYEWGKILEKYFEVNED